MTRNLWRHLRHEAISIAWILSIVLGCFLAVPIAQAGIVASSGVVQQSPPASVYPGASPSPGSPVAPVPIIFPEVTSGVAPGGGIGVDHKVAGDTTIAPVKSGTTINTSPGTIPAGTPYQTYFFHFDPNDSDPNSFLPHYYTAQILFDTPILGIQLFSNGDVLNGGTYTGKLEVGDALSGAPSRYPSGLVFRGLEEDTMQINNGGFGILFDGQAFRQEIDQARIYVSTVPEPASLAMAFVGFCGIMAFGITRSRAVRS